MHFPQFRFIPYYYRDIKYWVKHHLVNPRRKMRNKVFPPTWNDLPDMIVNFHLAVISEYVENEKCFEHNDYTWNEEQKQFAKELREMYHYVKWDRNILLKQIELAYKEVPSMTLEEIRDLCIKDKSDSLFVRYEEVDKLTKQLLDKDNEICNWVIKNRDTLWT
jgi:hypothetical protein